MSASAPLASLPPLQTEAESIATISQTGILELAKTQRYMHDRWTSLFLFAVIVGAILAALAIFHR